MKFNFVTLIGFLAASCTTLSFLPQLIRVIKTGDTKAISLIMYIVFTIGIALWLIYGLYINDMPIIISNIVTMIFCASVLTMKIKNG
jgi:MtN3 and saliva related transmembrane protein